MKGVKKRWLFLLNGRGRGRVWNNRQFSPYRPVAGYAYIRNNWTRVVLELIVRLAPSNFPGTAVDQPSNHTSRYWRAFRELGPVLKVKNGEVYTTTGHDDTEVKERYSSTLSLTWVLDGGGWSAPCPGRFTPGKDPVPIAQGAEWTPGSASTGAEKSRPHRGLIPGPSSP